VLSLFRSLCKKAPYRGLFVFGLFLFASQSLYGAAVAPQKAAVATAHPLATEVGHELLTQGGNAFDAAVGVSAALAVVEPYSSGIGGGGFWLLHRAGDGFETMVDGRERAPLAAHRDLYLGADGEVVPGLSIDGPLAAGIPGLPAALVHMAEEYGRLPLHQTLAPAIRLAREGFPVDEQYRRMAQWRLEALRGSPAAARQFLSEDDVPPAGWVLRQPDLAKTLQLLADSGIDGFYRGAVAEQLVAGVRGAGGIWTLEDLQQYRVLEREPIRVNYRGMKITSAAPPSSGGVLLAIMLNTLARFDLPELSPVTRTHLLVESMRRAYRDRAEHLGDPDHVAMPLGRLTHSEYGADLARSIPLDRAAPLVDEGLAPLEEGRDTTHFSILDREGNRVAATLSINYPFGSGFVPDGTGVLLNDEMDDFSARPGVPNVYGLVGGEANAIAPGKRMLSSMTPTFVETDRGVAIVGTPGGSRIISMVLLAILELEQGKGAEAWVRKPRFHHQYLPDEIQYEPGALSQVQQEGLKSLGHNLQPLERTYGNMQALYWDRQSGQVTAASDPRGGGSASVR
jgi:gamma-glutamyltranspeptidase/glutathione hydrolase